MLVHPLSVWTYYLHNKRKVAPVMAIIALAILAISSTGALTESLFADDRKQLSLYDHYAVVSQQGGISEAVLQRLGSASAIEQMLPMEGRSTRIQGIFGNQGRTIFFLANREQQAFAARMRWELTEGRWPQPGTNEVAVSQNILRNRDLQVGDHLGRATKPDDFINGDWVIVGALSNSYTGGIGDLDYFRNTFQSTSANTGRPVTVLVAPPPGQQPALETFLRSLPSDQVNVNYRSRVLANYENEIANANMIIWVLNTITIIVLSLALGLLNVIFFMQRSNEIGLLEAIGYTRGFLIRRTLLEAVTTSLIGWGVGIMVSEGIYTVVNALVFTPSGLSPLTALTQRVLLFTAPVPLALMLFSGGIVLWQLLRFDPIAIIERRD